MLGVNINASSHALLIEVGTVNDDGVLAFGETAEATMFKYYGAWEVKVGQASPGAQPIEVAARRVAAFQKALEIGSWLQANVVRFEDPDTIDGLKTGKDMAHPELQSILDYAVIRTYGFDIED